MGKKFVYQAVSELSDEKIETLLKETEFIFSLSNPTSSPRSKELEEIMNLDYHKEVIDKLKVVLIDLSNELEERKNKKDEVKSYQED